MVRLEWEQPSRVPRFRILIATNSTCVWKVMCFEIPCTYGKGCIVEKSGLYRIKISICGTPLSWNTIQLQGSTSKSLLDIPVVFR